MKKTKYCSYCVNDVADGCKLCVKGKKLVLFISGICDVNCYYCSLSDVRKNKDIVWANERICKNVKDIINEVKESNATGAGITGGDPFLRFDRTLKYAKALKKNFKNFHIHIYFPTKHVSDDKLKKLSKYIDEVRFHPQFLINDVDDIDKIKLSGKYFNKKNIGIELPLIPEKKEKILDFIIKISPYIGFVNLNELEIGDTNFKYVVNKYKMKDYGYVVSGSKEAGLWILKRLNKSGLKIHLCTAKLKNLYQYKNRLLLHNILPYGYRTKEGTARYLVINSIKDFNKLKKYKEIYLDKRKNRIILSEKVASKLIGKYKIFKIEEYPTYDGKEIVVESCN